MDIAFRPRRDEDRGYEGHEFAGEEVEGEEVEDEGQNLLLEEEVVPAADVLEGGWRVVALGL